MNKVISTRQANALTYAIVYNNNVLDCANDTYTQNRLLKLELVSRISSEVITVNDAGLTALRAWYATKEHVSGYAAECEKVTATYRATANAAAQPAQVPTTDSNETLRATIIAAVVTIMVDQQINDRYPNEDTALLACFDSSDDQERAYIALMRSDYFDNIKLLANIRQAFEAARMSQPIGMTLACSCGECADCNQPTKPEPYDCPVEINSAAAALDVQLYSGVRCSYTGNLKIDCRCYYCNLQSQAVYSVHKTFFGGR